MPVYRVDFANGEFYIGKCVDMRQRLFQHKCPTGGGLKFWFPHLDINTAKMTAIDYETETETLLEVENRHIRLHLENELCLNKRRSIRTEEEAKKARANWHKEHPDMVAEYTKKYNEKYEAEHGESRWKQYYDTEEKKAEQQRKQRERYASMTPEQKAHKLELGKIAKAKKKEADKSLCE
jgi:hypothetical protein